METGKETEAKRFLSELKEGEKAVIIRVKGYGAFRKRITEMGFIRGTVVNVIKKAPLLDPIEYELMGYHVSLRRSEAELIEVLSEEEAAKFAEPSFEGTITVEQLRETVQNKEKTINVALVGNPNCGKTTLFNLATGRHERVGNYSGVTVDLKTARLTHNGYEINLTDLPGTYSISEYSPEELYVRHHLTNEMPDVVVNVIDASNLERNLYLTTQLIDMNIKVIIALNMYDELEKSGAHFDYKSLAAMIGVPIVPTVAAKGKGISELFDEIIAIDEEREPVFRHIHISYGSHLNLAIEKVSAEIRKNEKITDKYHTHYVAVKLLEDDKTFTSEIENLGDSAAIIERAARERAKLEKEFSEKTSSLIADAKYAFIRGALKETYRSGETKISVKSYRPDRLLTHKWLGFPIFIFFMWAMFQATFTLGSYPVDWISAGVDALGRFIGSVMPDGALHDLIIDGIIGGVGGVIVFLPNILILFFCISLMEDTGYMARAAFIMDRLMHKIGLHGKSFIPMLMGFGCNVPAIMATRTLESRKDRLLTMMIIPFMSCSARLPVYVLLISAFFPKKQGLVLLSVYLIGVLVAIVTSLLFNKLFFSKKEAPFVMELPPYRVPTIRNTLIHMWDKSVQYLSKMGTVILGASIIIWALGYFPREKESVQTPVAVHQLSVADSTLQVAQNAISLGETNAEMKLEHMENSYIGKIGHFIAPVIAPLGFDWKIGVSIVTGFAAKEIVVGSMGVLYPSGEAADEASSNLQTKLQQQVYSQGPKAGQKVFTPLVAFTFMLFVLLYFPCIATITAIKREAGNKWALFVVLYTTLFAWLVAFGFYQIGSLF
ncbi:MAG TPA: ferrous iron transport protein B [Prolixibacteraceae bacterium]|nr:ferrous iron transport protein B [Prolixibacteraceae bacterium]HPS12638.1 ferrous iron transport protein B [Prolixibacteraceae bacterium]